MPSMFILLPLVRHFPSCGTSAPMLPKNASSSPKHYGRRGDRGGPAGASPGGDGRDSAARDRSGGKTLLRLVRRVLRADLFFHGGIEYRMHPRIHRQPLRHDSGIVCIKSDSNSGRNTAGDVTKAFALSQMLPIYHDFDVIACSSRR